MATRCTLIRHWFPIVTFCPVNGLPDLIYVTLEYYDDSEDAEVHELYEIRRRVRKLISWRKAFMEDIASLLAIEFQDADITVRLAFNRHEVKLLAG